MRFLRALVTSLFLLAAAVTAHAAPVEESGWTAVWATSAQMPSKTMGPNWSEGGFSNHTLRQVVRVSQGGVATRVRLTNRYGTEPLAIAGATIAVTDAGANIRLDTLRPLAFGLASEFRIPAGADLTTDPVLLPVAPFQSLTITLHLAEPTGPATHHAQALAATYRATGDHRADGVGTAFTETTQSWYYLSGVEVFDVLPHRSGVVTFGDSITEGVRSTPDADNRYPDELAERLTAEGNPRAVIDQGIGGNRVTVDSSWLGDSAQRRFRTDVLDQPGVGTVIILAGINDIGLSTDGPGAADTVVPVSTDQLVAGHLDLIRQARAKGLRVIGATLTPIHGSPYFSPAAESARQALNAWIRTAGAYDAVVDFDAALRDPADPQRFAPEFDSGDHIHPSDAGYAAMAAAVNPAEFG
ncbi:SGNH/GDSL hydrolase family protein [Nocardia sp. NBC_01009]|uniref:SGNH/GDSL hydrolase family protein n=1 Tax=Nocardia sp. NBC_01009 TaxID=2975996 RepID=UPI0038662D10|nr:SGNH/GDSL hydrolase family protein [Nocardia sp. NBC_01009]